ncbi:MAG: ATP-binding protein [Anaerolineae bacterium]
MAEREHAPSVEGGTSSGPPLHDAAWARSLIDVMVEGIVTLDADSRITFLNAGAERILGFACGDVLGKGCDDVFQSLSPGGSFSALMPPPGGRCTVPVSLCEGRKVVLSITRTRGDLPVVESAGEPETILIIRDISEEEVIRRLLGNFLANVAHELRTPLSALAASVQLLLDQLPDLSSAELTELLGSLHLGVWRLENLVDNLLEAASLEAGHFRVFAHPCNVREIIAEAVFTVQALLDQHQQRLVLEVPEALPFARADFRRTVQVLVNLLSNASKYGPEGGVITLTASVTSVPIAGQAPSAVSTADVTAPSETVPQAIRIAIADQGPGLPRDARARLVSASPYTSQAATGRVGLGLSVVRAIVRAQRGDLGVDTASDGGAIVYFTLPVALVGSPKGKLGL